MGEAGRGDRAAHRGGAGHRGTDRHRGCLSGPGGGDLLRDLPGGKTILGSVAKWSGPDGMFGANQLTESLRQAGLTLRRFKTGTPPGERPVHRLFPVGMSGGDEDAMPFSFETEKPAPNRVCCHITYTNEKTHAIIRANLDRSPSSPGSLRDWSQVLPLH